MLKNSNDKDTKISFEARMDELVREAKLAKAGTTPFSLTSYEAVAGAHHKFARLMNNVIREINAETEKEIALDQEKATNAGFSDYNDYSMALLATSESDRLAEKIIAFSNILEVDSVVAGTTMSVLIGERVKKSLKQKSEQIKSTGFGV